MGFFAKYVRKWQFKLANKLVSAYHFKYFQNIQFKNHGIAPTPPYLPTLKAYPTPGVGGRFEIFSLKWRERMNLKVPRAILPLGCAILSTRAITVRGGWYNPPLGELGLMYLLTVFFMKVYIKLRIKWLLTSCLASFLWWLSVWCGGSWNIRFLCWFSIHGLCIKR